MTKQRSLVSDLLHESINDSYDKILSLLTSIQTDWEKAAAINLEVTTKGLETSKKGIEILKSLKEPLSLLDVARLSVTSTEMLVSEFASTRTFIAKIGKELVETNKRITDMGKELSLLKSSLK